MDTLKFKRNANLLIIGENPELIVNLESQENYIKTDDDLVPYMQEVEFSEDLLNGKREHVFLRALNYYYEQACEVYQGMLIARAYRKNMNTEIREIL